MKNALARELCWADAQNEVAQYLHLPFIERAVNVTPLIVNSGFTKSAHGFAESSSSESSSAAKSSALGVVSIVAVDIILLGPTEGVAIGEVVGIGDAGALSASIGAQPPVVPNVVCTANVWVHQI